MQTFCFLIRFSVRKVVMILEFILPCNDVERAVQLYGRKVQSLAFVYLKNRFDAEDAAQDAFLAYFQKAPLFLSAQKEKAWLMQVTVNRCKDMLRAKHREELPLTEDISYLPQEESQVLEAVLSLEEIYRISIHLHYYEGYSLKEIGKLLGVPSGTVGSWLSRGREQLKRMLGGNEYGK